MYKMYKKLNSHNECIAHCVELEGVDCVYTFDTEKEANTFVKDWLEFIGEEDENHDDNSNNRK